jgi:RNA polymerase sigma-70 factor, ECF subfamily
VRRDLCSEAIRLGRLLSELLPDEPENLGLLALMLLHDSRRETRVADGQLVTLEEQDRSRWDQAQMREGLRLVEQALQRRPLGPYQLQAAIAAVHAEAKTAPETDWHQIARLYEKLLEFNGSAVIALNHAAAVAMSGRLEEGLARIDVLDLDRYYLFHAARADILRRMNRPTEAMEAYRKALALATNRVEQEFLERRLKEYV